MTPSTVAVFVIAFLIAGGVLSLARHAADPWATAEGRNMSAGFVDGCTQTTRALMDCRCLLDALRATPSYNTPERFASLGPELARARGELKLMSTPYLAAVHSCRH